MPFTNNILSQFQDFINDKLNLNQFNYDELLDEILKLNEDEQNSCWEQLVKQDHLHQLLNKVTKVVSNPDSKLIEFIADSCKNSKHAFSKFKH